MTPLEGMRLFPEFAGKSWAAWRKVLARLTPAVREFYAICGRGSGKSRIVGLLACAFAMRDYPRVSGESIYIGVFAPDKKQAGVTFRYILGLLRSVPSTAALIVTARRESVELSNGIIVEVLSSTIAAPRGRAYALAIVEEASFLPQDLSANPDVELLRSLRPALARVKGSLLAVVSSPYARKGVLWHAWQRYHDQPDGDVVLLCADTRSLNPTFDSRAIDRAFEEDEPAAWAEYGRDGTIRFRTDVETFLSVETIDGSVVKGRSELAPLPSRQYEGVLDAASGTGTDALALGIGHREVGRDGQPIAVLDVLREARPPFQPAKTITEFAVTLKRYLGPYPTVRADRYAYGFVEEALRNEGVTLWPFERVTSDIYREALPWLNARRVELLDNPRLIMQLTGLERRPGRSGRDIIDHAINGHDDLCTVALGVALELLTHPQAGGVGEVAWDFNPYAADGIEAAKRLYGARAAAALCRAELDRPKTAGVDQATGAQAALDRDHDALSPVPRRARVFRRVTAADDTSHALTDFDPFGPNRGFDPYE